MKLFCFCDKGESVDRCVGKAKEIDAGVPVKLAPLKYGDSDAIEDMAWEFIKVCGKDKIWENDKLWNILTLLRELEGGKVSGI